MKANFKFKEEIVKTKLNDIDLFKLENHGIKSILGQLKQKVWLGLKLRGESVIISEIKFLGLDEATK